jgi:hypothetical protein
MTCAAAVAVGLGRQAGALRSQHSLAFAKTPWNKGRLIGQKLFNLAIDSKLRGCDHVRRVNDVCSGGRVRDRARLIRQKPRGLAEQTRVSIRDWIASGTLRGGLHLVPKISFTNHT